MMSQTPYSMQAHCNGKESVGSCQVEFYTKGGAISRGIKMFVLTLLAAIFSILLPGMHFITVPLGILASPFVGIYFYVASKDSVKMMTGEFFCPECQATNQVAFRGRPPYSSKCVQCENNFKVEPLL
jgi:hypothetical protein